MLAYSLYGHTDLRLLEPEHSEELFQLTEDNRPQLLRWFSWTAGVKSVYDTRSFIDDLNRRRRIGDAYGYGVFDGPRLCGVAELTGAGSPDKCGRIGFWLCASDHGKGRMTAACDSLTDFAFGACGLNRVEIHADVDNVRGRAVPERLGYRLEGVARQAKRRGDRYADIAVYSMLASEWEEMERLSKHVGY